MGGLNGLVGKYQILPKTTTTLGMSRPRALLPNFDLLHRWGAPDGLCQVLLVHAFGAAWTGPSAVSLSSVGVAHQP